MNDWLLERFPASQLVHLYDGNQEVDLTLLKDLVLQAHTNNTLYWLSVGHTWLIFYIKNIKVRPQKLPEGNSRLCDAHFLQLDPDSEEDVKKFIAEMSFREIETLPLQKLPIAPSHVFTNLQAFIVKAAEKCMFTKTQDALLHTLSKLTLPGTKVLSSVESPFDYVARTHGFAANELIRPLVERKIVDAVSMIKWDEPDAESLATIIALIVETIDCPNRMLAINNEIHRTPFPIGFALRETLATCGDHIGVRIKDAMLIPSTDDPSPLSSIAYFISLGMCEEFHSFLSDPDALNTGSYISKVLD